MAETYDTPNPEPVKDVLEDENRREKLMRLLGGKKTNNVEAGEKWIKKARSTDKELILKHGLEEQYKTSMSHAVDGKTKRHEGIGYDMSLSSSASPVNQSNVKEESLSSSDRVSREGKSHNSPSSRHRSRSPIKKQSDLTDQNKSAAVPVTLNQSACDNTNTVSSETKITTMKNKKQFYMQFKKASDS